MGILRAFCILLKKKKTPKKVSKDIKELGFDNLKFTDFKLDTNTISIIKTHNPNQKNDSIYIGKLGITFKDEPISLDVYFIDGVKSFLQIWAVTSFHSTIIAENLDYFSQIFKTITDFDVLTFTSEDDEILSIYSYEDMKKYRDIESYWQLI